MHQSYDCSLGVAVPETPLRAIELGQRMAANPTIDNSEYALCDLLKIRKSHRDVEPIQYMVSIRGNLLLDRTQTGIAIGENRNPSGFIRSEEHTSELQSLRH